MTVAQDEFIADKRTTGWGMRDRLARSGVCGKLNGYDLLRMNGDYKVSRRLTPLVLLYLQMLIN